MRVVPAPRRWVMGALEHQHAPLPQDEDGPARPYQFSGGSATHQGQDPWWLKWSSSAVRQSLRLCSSRASLTQLPLSHLLALGVVHFEAPGFKQLGQ